jgi:hypothetical protein
MERIIVTISDNTPVPVYVMGNTTQWVIAILGVLTEDQRRRVYARVERKDNDLHPPTGRDYYPFQRARAEND